MTYLPARMEIILKIICLGICLKNSSSFVEYLFSQNSNYVIHTCRSNAVLSRLNAIKKLSLSASNKPIKRCLMASLLVTCDAINLHEYSKFYSKSKTKSLCDSQTFLVNWILITQLAYFGLS